MKNILLLFCALPLFFLFACTPKNQFGCSNKQQKNALKLYAKATDICETAIIAKMLQLYPIDTSTHEVVRVIKGDADTTYVPVYVNCDSLQNEKAKGVKVNTASVAVNSLLIKTRDTIEKLKQKTIVDGRAIALLNINIGNLEKRLAAKELERLADQQSYIKSVQKINNDNIANKTRANLYRNILLAIGGIAALVFGVKFILPKFLK